MSTSLKTEMEVFYLPETPEELQDKINKKIHDRQEEGWNVSGTMSFDNMFIISFSRLDSNVIKAKMAEAKAAEEAEKNETVTEE